MKHRKRQKNVFLLTVIFMTDGRNQDVRLSIRRKVVLGMEQMVKAAEFGILSVVIEDKVVCV